MSAYLPKPAPIADKNGYVTTPWLMLFQQLIGGLGTAPGVLSNPSLTTPAGVADGDFWVEATGTSPTRTISLMVRDGGSNHTVAAITY